MKKEYYRDLIQRYFLGTISEDEMLRLDQRLKSDREFRSRFAAMARLDTNLRDAAVSMPEIEAEAGPEALHTRRYLLIGLGAAALIVFVTVFFFAIRSRPSTKLIARVAELNGAVTWIADGKQAEGALEIGEELTGGTLEVSSLDSWIELVFRDQSSVWVSGPAVVTISDGEAGKMIRLREGDLSLEVRPQPEGRPMRVITPSAEAVVLGTQFNVSASPTSTSLIVNEGKVKVTRLADGRVEEVGADHRLVAALEQESRFEARPRGDEVRFWKSELPRDARQGTLRVGPNGHADLLRAEAHLFRGDHGEKIEPVLLHSAVLGPSIGRNRPVLLSEGARFRIRGRLDEDYKISFGFGTHHDRGGFSGKFSTKRTIERDAQGWFEIELALADFQRMRSRFVESPVGHELVWLWIQTYQKDVGLGVFSVELLSLGAQSED